MSWHALSDNVWQLERDICMNSPTDNRRSNAAKASWASLGLALGCLCLYFVFQQVDQMSPFDRTRQGLLTDFLPRTGLYVLWAGEAFAVVAGVGSFLLIRRKDFASDAIIGIVARSLCGIAVGLYGVIVLWLIVGHIVIGF